MWSSRDTPTTTSGWFPVVVSVVGLVLTAMAVAQYSFEYILYSPDDDDDDDENSNENYEKERQLEDLRRWYHSRRVIDRLSYENLEDPMVVAASTTSTNYNHGSNENTWRRGNTRDHHAPPIDRTATAAAAAAPPPPRDNNSSEWDLLQRPSNDRYSMSPSPSKIIKGKDKENNTKTNPPSLSLSERHDTTTTGSSSVVADLQHHPNADYDFHPKNRNWRHFEHFNEQDPRRATNTTTICPTTMQTNTLYTQSLPSSSSIRNPSLEQYENTDLVGQAAFQQLQRDTTTNSYRSNDHSTNNSNNNNNKESGNLHARMLDTDDEQEDDENDDDDEDDNADEANSISSSGSESSEEQFVWMKHPHRSKIIPSPKEDGWPEAIRKRVPSFLSLFHLDDPTTTATAPEEKSPVVENEVEDPATASVPAGRPPTEESPSSSLLPIIVSSTGPGSTSNKLQEAISFPRVLQRLWGRRNSINDGSAHHEPKKRKSTRPELSTSHSNNNNNNTHHRQLRAQYNATIMPAKVILMRHGQSMGNINELLYATTPDNAMPLTQLGWEQARAAGRTLKNKILTRNETVHFIVSPYVRTVETFHGIVSAWCDPKEFAHIANKEKRIKAWYRRLMEMGLTWNEDSRIREQDFGNYQDPEIIRKAKQERHRFGIFYYRYPHGESASDVFDRVSTFLDSLWRSFEMNKSRNYVLVTHGISIRVLLARYFRYTIDQFNILANPKNCEMVILGHNGQGRLELQGRCALELGPQKPEVRQQDEEPNEQAKNDANNKADDSSLTTDNHVQPSDGGELHVTGYKFHKRLRILPRHAIRKIKIRISPDD